MTAEQRPNRIYAEVEVAMLYLKGARNRAEAALVDLRKKRGEAYAVEALERAIDEMTETLAHLRQDGLRLDPVADVAA